jgi:hypothetical protein
MKKGVVEMSAQCAFVRGVFLHWLGDTQGTAAAEISEFRTPSGFCDTSCVLAFRDMID